MIKDLAELRRNAGLGLLILLWIHVGLTLGVAALVGTDWLWPSLAMAALAGVATAAYRLDPIGQSSRLVTSSLKLSA